MVEIVAVDRPDVIEAEFLEQGAAGMMPRAIPRCLAARSRGVGSIAPDAWRCGAASDRPARQQRDR